MITHDHKMIYVHIPKCAGRSISEIFKQRFGHYTLNYYFQTYHRYFNEYTIFTTVRNPYSRLVSIYHYIQEHRRHSTEPIACNGANFKDWAIKNLSACKRFFDMNNPEGERGTDGDVGSVFWFTPQTNFLLIPGISQLPPDIHIFKLEEGMENVLNFVKRNGTDVPDIPHINKSSHRSWQHYYDEELMAFVNEHDFIKTDCAFLYYKKEYPRLYKIINL